MVDKRPEAATAQRIIRRVVRDIEDRQGLGDAWTQVAPAVQREIRGEWGRIIREELGLPGAGKER